MDLGDKGSVVISDLTEEVCIADNEQSKSPYFKHESGEKWKSMASRDYCIYQDSSGGDNWQNNNHINAAGEIPVKFRGYKYFDNGVEIDADLRANPQYRLNFSSASFGTQQLIGNRLSGNLPDNIGIN